MFERDQASRNLGMKITHVAPGKATVTMPVTSIMIQGHGSCHGGYLFTLADSTFAFDCNSYNKANVASCGYIEYLIGARVFFFQAEDGIRDGRVTGVQTCALPI